MARKKQPELTFQDHIADYLVRVHKYGVLEQTDITDTEHFIAEDHLWAFLKATQADTLKKLTDDYGTDARDEVFRALRKELEHTPLWMLFRQGLPVRGLEFRLFYPKPRSTESAAVKKYTENRITFRPHFYFGETNQEIDFVLFLILTDRKSLDTNSPLQPSEADIETTRRLREAGELMGIVVLDHLDFQQEYPFQFPGERYCILTER